MRHQSTLDQPAARPPGQRRPLLRQPADRSRPGSAPAARPLLSENSRSAALATLCLVLFLTFLDITIVSVALAGIQTQLHAGVSSLQWVVGAYALTFAATMLTFGTLGDQFGRKKIMLIGICVFIVGAVMAGASVLVTSGSSALAIVIAGRAVMGLGAAASEPGTLSMLRHIYPEYTSRNWALGVWAAVSGSALALGPVVGGALVYAWGWPSIFWFNVLFGLIALVATVIVIPENADPTGQRIDLAGAVFGAIALASLIFAVIDAESSGFGSAKVIALLCVSAVFAVAFLWQESRAAHPLLDLRFLRIPQFATPNIVAFCAYFATFAIFFFTALFLEEVAGYNGGQIAMVFLPMTILMILASLLAGRWTGTVGVRWSIVGGCAAFAGGLLWTNAVISPHPPYLPLAAALALTGIGIGACVVPITSSVLATVPARAIRHGRVDHEHQPRGRRGDGRRHPRGDRHREAADRAGRQPHQARPAEVHPADRHQRRADRPGAVGRRLVLAGSGRPGRAGARGHPRHVLGIPGRAARRALRVGRAGRGGRHPDRCHHHGRQRPRAAEADPR